MSHTLHLQSHPKIPLIPHFLKGWPALTWYPKTLIHLQTCGSNSIPSGSHQAFKTSLLCSKHLINFPHIAYYTTCSVDFSGSLFILPAPNQTAFLQPEDQNLSTIVSSFLCVYLPWTRRIWENTVDAIQKPSCLHAHTCVEQLDNNQTHL